MIRNTEMCAFQINGRHTGDPVGLAWTSRSVTSHPRTGEKPSGFSVFSVTSRLPALTRNSATAPLEGERRVYREGWSQPESVGPSTPRLSRLSCGVSETPRGRHAPRDFLRVCVVSRRTPRGCSLTPAAEMAAPRGLITNASLFDQSPSAFGTSASSSTSESATADRQKRGVTSLRLPGR